MSVKPRLTLRRVALSDAVTIYGWFRDVETTRFSVTPKPDLSWQEHIDWFISALRSRVWRVWFMGETIVEGRTEPVGVARFDVADNPLQIDGLFISVIVAPEFRGKGYGAELIRLASRSVGGVVKAQVHVLNTPSERAFLKAGYKLQQTVGPWQTYVWSPER